MKDVKLQEFSNFLMSGQFCSRYNNRNDDMIHNLNMISYYSKIMTLAIYRVISTPVKDSKDLKEKKDLITSLVSYISRKYIRKCIIGDLSYVIKDSIRKSNTGGELDVLVNDFKNKLDNPYLNAILEDYYNEDFTLVKEVFIRARDDVRNSYFKDMTKDSLDIRLIKRLENTYRWNNTPLHTKFSILEHQFVTAIITYAFMLNSKTKHSKVDMSLTVVGSLFHDILEIVTDDVIRPIKKLIPEVLEETEKDAIKIVLDTYFKNMVTTGSSIRGNTYLQFLGTEFSTLRSHKSEIIKYRYNGDIVQMCDNVSAYSELTFDNRSKKFVTQIQRIIDGDKKVSGITGDRCELLYAFSKYYKKNFIEKLWEKINE